ncbi:branched-chain amino acid transport system ATP-binding protein [Rhodoligotrophos appendicifer]|uniref:ABC transporter ATP-binding protein n=1 Tax=Rhodoligotrophos appendicifer TaxID=987056 RepID=UPI001185C973|nr:ABC transporter ATP-binding protein [Rhodoligotrophos appendicifer]
MAGEIILSARGLTKVFGGLHAVRDVDLDVRRGSIHALIGPNGAGKTTCFNLLTKFLPLTRGQIKFKGLDVTSVGPADIARMGLVRSFQLSSVFPNLTVAENVRVALQRTRGESYDFWRSAKVLQRFDAKVRSLLEVVRLTEWAERPVGELSYGRKRALEVATTLALEPELLLLDEPTAGMGGEDIEHITQLIKSVSKDRTILMVEHNLAVVASLSDTITVLAQGQIVAEGDHATISKDPVVIEAYMGSGHA